MEATATSTLFVMIKYVATRLAACKRRDARTVTGCSSSHRSHEYYEVQSLLFTNFFIYHLGISRCGEGEFTITIKDRVVEGKAKAKTIQIVNQFIDEHEIEIMEIWEKAQRGEKIEKIRR